LPANPVAEFLNVNSFPGLTLTLEYRGY